MNIEKINNITIKTIEEDKTKNKKIIGYDMFKQPYANILLSASKNSGKTTLIINILEKLILKRKNEYSTDIYLFSTTAHNDPLYTTLKKQCEQYNIQLNLYDDDNYKQIFEDDDIINKLSTRAREYEETNKDKIIYPLSIFVFDDINISSHFLYEVMKKNRHYKISIIISTQYYKNLNKNCRN